jgi:hypothetical protein
MRVPRGVTIWKVALVAGLAIGLIAVLLWWMGRQSPVIAATGLVAGTNTQVNAATKEGARLPAWDSTTPVTTEIVDWHTEYVWLLPQYGMTVTFPGGAVFGAAVFTFTPELADAVPPPLLATPYFFEVRGTYTPYGNPVSLFKAIDLDLKYDPSTLGNVTESTLYAYYYSSKSGWIPLNMFPASEEELSPPTMPDGSPAIDAWLPTDEDAESSSSVDTARDLVHITTRPLGHFGILGYRSQSFMPLCTHSFERPQASLDQNALLEER